MYFYFLYGCVIKSDLAFMQLVPAEETENPDIVLCCGTETEGIQEKLANQQLYEAGKEITWFGNNAGTLKIEKGTNITYYLRTDNALSRLKNSILGYGMAMLFMQRGELAIHCSALHNGKEAILISGESGSGKSTLTNSYLAKGWSLMADDMVIVRFDKENGTMVYPAFPYQKLCRNVAVERGYDLNELLYINEQKDKFLVPWKGEFDVAGKLLKNFLMLRVHTGGEVEVHEMKSIDKLHVCVNNLFLREAFGKERYSPYIVQKCLELIANVDVHLIARPAGKDTTEEIKKAAFDIIL